MVTDAEAARLTRRPTISSDEGWSYILDAFSGLVVGLTMTDKSTMDGIIRHHAFTDSGWIGVRIQPVEENDADIHKGPEITVSIEDIENIEVY